MCDQSIWQSVWRQMPEHRYRYCDIPTVDMSWCNSNDDGFTDGGAFEAIARALKDQLAGEQPLQLVGFSLGGYVAAVMACAYPQLIESVTLVAAGSLAVSERERQERCASLELLENYAYRGIAEGRIRQMLHPQQWSDKVITDVIKSMDKHCGLATLKWQFRHTTERRDLTAQLLASGVKVNFVAGSDDKLMPAEHIRSCAEHISHANFELLDNTGHMLPLEAPQPLATLLTRWLL